MGDPVRKLLIKLISGVLFVLLCGISLTAADTKVVRVGAFDYFPAIFLDTDGMVKGFYVDALADIGERENIRFEYVYGTWNEGLERIKTGEVDVLTSVAFTEERARFLDYTDTPLLTVWAELYTSVVSGIDGILDVNGKTIAVMKGDYNAGEFTNLTDRFNISFDIIEKPSFAEVFQAVASREADAGVVNNTFGRATHQEYNLRSTGLVFNPFDIFFAVAKGQNQDLLALLEANLAHWRREADSPYENARRKWLYPPSTITVVPRWLIIVLISVCLFALIAGVFVFMLRQQVQKKTLSLSESAERFRVLADRQKAILTSIPDIIMENNASEVYTWANPAGLDFFGKGVIGNETRFYYEGEQESHENIQPPVKGEGQVIYAENLQRRRDGEIRLLAWWRKVLTDDRGAVTGSLSTARDITEQRRAEEEREKLQHQLVQAQKMESVGRLAGGVAHDFNNMLGVILGYADMAVDMASENNLLYTALNEIRSAAQRSADLTRQLLTFARKQMISPKVLNLNDEVQQMITMLGRLIGEDIELIWRPSEELEPVLMDSSQVHQILANLCINARDSISGVGKIIIETAMKTFEPDCAVKDPECLPGDYILLAVSDNGCGMDDTTLNSLFEPFFTTKGYGKGTGLGLAMVYGIVKQNHGLIDVYSEPGLGTTFKIYLPRYKTGDAVAVIPSTEGTVQGGHEIVLLVEDEPSILELTRTMLEDLGYRVLTASTPKAALWLARRQTEGIDMLLTDVVMPEMDGSNLARELTSLYPDLKLLFMSGYTADIIADHGVLDRNVCFIQKPFSKNEIARKVREALSRGALNP